MEALLLVFAPFWATCAAAVSAPVLLAVRRAALRRGAERNRECACGRCGKKFVRGDGDIFAADGVFICDGCAHRARRRLSVFLPVGLALTATVAVTSLAGVLLSDPSLKWWLDWRWIPAVTPTVALGLGTWLSLRLAKRRNEQLKRVDDDAVPELAGADVDAMLTSGDTLAEPGFAANRELAELVRRAPAV